MAYDFETVALGLQLAMGIATVEGEITHTSGKLLKDWALDEIGRHPAADRQELKDVLNQAMKDAYRRSLKSNLDLIAMAESFSRSPDEVLKSRIITLCRMMAGDDDRKATTTLIADLSRIIVLSTQSRRQAVGPESYSSALDQLSLIHI